MGPARLVQPVAAPDPDVEVPGSHLAEHGAGAVEQLVIDEVPWVIVYTKRWFNLWHPYVGGFTVNPSRTQDVGRVWIDAEMRDRALGKRAELPLSKQALTRRFAFARWR